MTSQKLFEILERYRINNDIDIPTFAKQLGLSPATYYNWRKGAPPKAIDVVINLLNLFPQIQEG